MAQADHLKWRAWIEPEKLNPLAGWLTIAFPVLLLTPVSADIGLSLLAVLFLVRSWAEKDWEWLKESWVQISGALWLYMIARGVTAEQPKEALERALPFGRYILFAAALARWTLKDAGVRRRFFYTLMGFIAFLACDGILQYIAGRDLLWHKLTRDPHNGHVRLAGAFTKPILGIMLAWLSFPALLPMLFGIGPFPGSPPPLRGKGYPELAYVVLLAVMAAIALSGERMALLLALFGWVLAILLLRIRLKRVAAGAAGLALLIGALALLAPDMASRQIASTADTLTHWRQSPYGMLLESDLTLAEKQPVIGLGANHFRIYCARLYPNDKARQDGMCNTHPHNIYFEWFIEEGVIGLLLFGAFAVAVLESSWRSYSRNPAHAGLIIAFILRVWPFMTATGFFSRWAAPPFWLAVGALLVYTAGKGEKNAGATLPLQDAGL